MTNTWIMEKQACVSLMLHHHQPFLLLEGKRVSNLAKMWHSTDDQQRWNVACYVGSYAELPRLAGALAAEGFNPAVMADFSGALLLGLEEAEGDGTISAMAGEKGGSRAAGVLPALRQTLESHPGRLELLATGYHHPLFHPAATPKADWGPQLDRYLALCRRLFGAGANLTGFWPPEMAVPGAPEDLYDLIAALQARGIRYMLLPSVPYRDDWNETALRPAAGRREGYHERFYMPHVLRGRKEGRENFIVTLARDPRAEPQKNMSFSDRGHNVAQGVAGEMAAKGERMPHPPLVVACSDGDNGDQMMQGNFLHNSWASFVRSRPEQGPIALVTATQYLEGVLSAHFGSVAWERAPEVFPEVVIQPEGYSWSGVLGNIWLNRPEKRELYAEIASLSEQFHRARPTPANEGQWNAALEWLLLAETSCYTWWGGGYWLEQAAEVLRRAREAVARL
ncbi:MAG: hypothetical protein V2A77_02125 [Pseudomonadota bacterium]